MLGDVQANASATRAVPLARLDVVDRDRRRRLPGPPFPAAQSLRNELVRLDQRFSGDRLRALLDPNKLVFFEVFSSAAAHEFHLEQDYTKRMFASLEGKVSGVPTLTKLSAL